MPNPYSSGMSSAPVQSSPSWMGNASFNGGAQQQPQQPMGGLGAALQPMMGGGGMGGMGNAGMMGNQMLQQMLAQHLRQHSMPGAAGAKLAV